MRTSVLLPALAAALVVVLLGAAGSEPGPVRTEDALPRFTEEREAAARYFVKKHLPELLPLLDQLKKDDRARYRREVRAIFQATELLADLREDSQRHDLELKVWVAENRVQVFAARLATPNADERKKAQAALRELGRQLVHLDLEILELKAERLERELNEVKEQAARIRDNREKYTQERCDALLQGTHGPKR
jgi:hypothetical protein